MAALFDWRCFRKGKRPSRADRTGLALALIFLLVSLAACSAPPAPPQIPLTFPEAYLVTAHRAGSSRWTMEKAIEGRRVRMTLDCLTVTLPGDSGAIANPAGCQLPVGQLLIPHRLGGRTNEPFLDIFQVGDTLFISEGSKPSQFAQTFAVVEATTLPE
ncbi:MAG: hypothetical protein QM736_16595 [Vicinamibacterales bacterium]